MFRFLLFLFVLLDLTVVENGYGQTVPAPDKKKETVKPKKEILKPSKSKVKEVPNNVILKPRSIKKKNS